MAYNFKANLKKAFSKTEIGNMLWGTLAIGTWIVVPSLLKKLKPEWFDGWVSYAVALGVTFFTGVVLDKAALRYSALAIGSVHIGYAKLSGLFEDMGITEWRLGGDLATSKSAMNGLNALNELVTIRSKEGYDYPARPALEEGNGLSGYLTQPQDNSVNKISFKQNTQMRKYKLYKVAV